MPKWRNFAQSGNTGLLFLYLISLDFERSLCNNKTDIFLNENQNGNDNACEKKDESREDVLGADRLERGRLAAGF